MSGEVPFLVDYDPATREHLACIASKYHSLIRRETYGQLRFTPDVTTRNRKPLKEPVVPGADWELRLGPDNRYRVFYRIDLQLRQVTVLAIGVKERQRILVGGKQVAP